MNPRQGRRMQMRSRLTRTIYELYLHFLPVSALQLLSLCAIPFVYLGLTEVFPCRVPTAILEVRLCDPLRDSLAGCLEGDRVATESVHDCSVHVERAMVRL